MDVMKHEYRLLSMYKEEALIPNYNEYIDSLNAL